MTDPIDLSLLETSDVADIASALETVEVAAAPAIEQPNIFPVDWNVEIAAMERLYHRAKKEQWDARDLPWDELRVDDWTESERIALAYSWATLGVVENNGPALFARALLHVNENHEGGFATKAMLGNLINDETRHEELAAAMTEAFYPLLTTDPADMPPLARLARTNLDWMSWNLGRFWTAYSKSYTKYPLPLITFAFLVGERSAMAFFRARADASTHPLFSESLHGLARDEARHFAFTKLLFESFQGRWDDDLRRVATKQLRAGFEFGAGTTGMSKDLATFWEFPAQYWDVHHALTETARTAGLGSLSEQEVVSTWYDALVQIRSDITASNIAFPAIPEVGLDGVEVSVSDDEVMVTTF